MYVIALVFVLHFLGAGSHAVMRIGSWSSWLFCAGSSVGAHRAVSVVFAFINASVAFSCVVPRCGWRVWWRVLLPRCEFMGWFYRLVLVDAISGSYAQSGQRHVHFNGISGVGWCSASRGVIAERSVLRRHVGHGVSPRASLCEERAGSCCRWAFCVPLRSLFDSRVLFVAAL